MSSVLIIDAGKSSLVMTSEAIKDKLPGTTVIIARSGIEGLTYLEKVQNFALIIIDFDLPDTDGASLARHIRSRHKTPILITAFLEPIVEEAIRQELFGYADVSDIVQKPVKLEDMSKKIDKYLSRGEDLEKRYETNLGATIAPPSKGKAAPKATPKVKGQIINLSLGGALLKTSAKMALKKGDEMVLNLDLAGPSLTKYKKLYSEGQQKLAHDQKRLTLEPKQLTNIKTKVIWVDKTKQQIGLKFDDLNDVSRHFFEGIMRNAKELE